MQNLTPANNCLMSNSQRAAYRARQMYELNRINRVDINNMGQYTPPPSSQNEVKFELKAKAKNSRWANFNTKHDIDMYNKDRGHEPQITPNIVVPLFRTKRIHKAEISK